MIDLTVGTHCHLQTVSTPNGRNRKGSLWCPECVKQAELAKLGLELADAYCLYYDNLDEADRQQWELNQRAIALREKAKS
jgi:hypothetical protein